MCKMCKLILIAEKYFAPRAGNPDLKLSVATQAGLSIGGSTVILSMTLIGGSFSVARQITMEFKANF